MESTQRSNPLQRTTLRTVLKDDWLIDWVGDFNGMSTRLGLFSTWRLGNCLHRTFIFLCIYFLKDFLHTIIWYQPYQPCGGARGVMVIVVGNGHGDTSSNPDCISHRTNTLGKGMNPIILPPTMGK